MADTHYSLEVIRAEGIPWKHTWTHDRVPSFYLMISVKGLIQRTKTIRREPAPVWNEALRFSSSNIDAILVSQLKHESSIGLRAGLCVGVAQMTLEALLHRSTIGEVKLELYSEDGPPGAPKGSIFLRVKDITQNEHVSSDLAKTMQAIGDIEIVHEEISHVQPVANEICKVQDVLNDGPSEIYVLLGNLVSKLDVFVKAMDVISEIHPYLSVAWTVTSALYKAVAKQFEADQAVVDLVKTIVKTYDFVTEAQEIRRKVNSLQEVIARLLSRTTESCLLIQVYLRDGFLVRMLRSKGDQIKDLQANFETMKRELDSGMTLQAALVTSRTAEKVDVLFLRSILNPAEASAFDKTQCLAGTRVEIRTEILEWLFSAPGTENVLWVHGVVGAGKSTVVMSIAEYVRSVGCLGAFMFFERDKSDSSTLFRTMAYQLASFNGSIAEWVKKAIEDDPSITTAPAERQFDRLLKGPLVNVIDAKLLDRPVVIILEALDECSALAKRKTLLQLLKRTLPQLPKNFRFLITSRREADIDAAFSTVPNIIRPMELDFNSAASQRDVLLYLDHELRQAIDYSGITIPPDWPWDHHIQQLADTAAGLFIWASTVVRIVSECDNPLRKLQELSDNTHNLRGMDSLYTAAFETCGISWEEESSRKRFSQVLSLLLLNKAPVSDDAIDGLLGFASIEPAYLVLSKLRSVLVYVKGAPIRFFHSSMIDYLRSPSRKQDPWFIDASLEEPHIAFRCLVVMEDNLRFNICGLESSFQSNATVTGLEERTKANIPSHLQYACFSWAFHVRDVPFSAKLLEKLSDLVYRRLLWYFEVMSLLRKFGKVGKALLDISNWISPHDSKLSSLLLEGSTLATTFNFPISQSAAHIYASALLWTKDSMELSAHYFRPTNCHLSISTFGNKLPPPWLHLLEGHTGPVNAVAVSPDGKHVISASRDTSVRVWDVKSGQPSMPLLESHAGGILGVAYSPNGRYIASASFDATLGLWDASSGAPIARSKVRKGLTSVAFSPDSKRVATGSRDQTISIWNVPDGTLVGEPWKGHNGVVATVAFSPNGNLLASGSWDSTVIIWDVRTGTSLRVLEPRANSVLSVAFSSDSLRLACGSWDRMLSVWDVESGQMVLGPIDGHSGAVNSVCFSPDDKYVLSGSRDGKIRLWKTASTEKHSIVAAGCFEGHFGGVLSVAYTPDGSTIVSGSDDHSVAVWDAHRNNGTTQSSDYHTGHVLSTVYTHDGSRIVSGSWDGTIRVWDAKTGGLVSGLHTTDTYGVMSVAILPGGTLLASASYDHTVRIWDLNTREVVCPPLRGHSDVVLCVAASPSQRDSRFASGSMDGTVRVWNLQEDKTCEDMFGGLRGHTGGITCVAFSIDGLCLASGSVDASLCLWDVKTGTSICKPLTGHYTGVTCVAFSPDGCTLASGSRDGSIRLWNISDGAHIAVIRTHGRCMCLAFSPRGTRIAAGTDAKTVEVWRVYSQERLIGPLEGHGGSISSVAFSPDGQRVVSGSRDATIRTWIIHPEQAIQSQPVQCTAAVTSVAFSRDGALIASGDKSNLLRVFRIEDGGLAAQPFKGHTQAVLSVAFSPDSTLIVTGSADRSVRIWSTRQTSGEGVGEGKDAATSKPLVLRGHKSAVTSVSFSPDGAHILSGSRDHTLILWNASTGTIIRGPLTGHTGGVGCITFASDGKTAASGSHDRTVKIWHLAEAEQETITLKGHQSLVSSVRFAPALDLIVSCSHDMYIKLWSSSDYTLKRSILTMRALTSVAFCSATKRIIAGSFGTWLPNLYERPRLLVYDAVSIEKVCMYEGHKESVSSVDISSDCRRILSGSWDKTMRIWDAEEMPAKDPSIWHLSNDGWIKNTSGELLLWAPPDFRATLWRPENEAVFSCAFSTRVELAKISRTDWMVYSRGDSSV